MQPSEKLSWRVDVAVLLAAALWTLLATTLGYFLFVLTCRLVFRTLLDTSTDFSATSVGRLILRFMTWPELKLIVAIAIGRGSLQAANRLWFHPLAKFPGSKVAALTGLYEFYYDVISGGRYTWAIESMHERYGPIVRISPSELHIDDVEFHDHLYTGATNPREKWHWISKVFQSDSSIIATPSHELHRKRRAPLNPFFSKKSVMVLLPHIREKVERLCKRISEQKDKQEPVSMKHAFGALTIDVVSEYAFGKSWGHLEEPDMGGWRFDSWEAAADGLWAMEFIPVLGSLGKSLPTWVVDKMNPGVAALMRVQEQLKGNVQDMISSWTSMPGESSPSSQKVRATIFHELLASPELPEADRNAAHLAEEAQTIMGGALSTNTRFLFVTLFYVLSDSKVLALLKQELETAMPDPDVLPNLPELEQLEYLTAVIAEGHRVAGGLSHRLARISPNAPIHFHEWEIPQGWPVGMTAMFMHQNKEVFPAPDVFDPERFRGPEGRARKKYLVPFSKGTRSCLGMNVANAVIYCSLAAVIRRFDLEIYETTRADVDMTRDYLAGFPPKGSKGLQVLVK